MTSFKRFGNRWTINECLQLEREFDLLELSIDEMAQRHQRTPNAIMLKLDSEGHADYNVLYSNYHALNTQIVSQTKAEEEEDEEEDEDEDIELDEDGEPIVKENVKKTNKVVKPKKATQLILEDEDEEDDEYDDNYLQKFDNDLIKNYVNEFHPECLNHNYDEIAKLSVVVRNTDNIIVDPLHRTIPYLTKYEKARILGQRAKQIETGARPLVKIPENIVDSYIIAELELREKKIPFIIRRPIPGGACEYWNLRDLEVIAF